MRIGIRGIETEEPTFKEPTFEESTFEEIFLRNRLLRKIVLFYFIAVTHIKHMINKKRDSSNIFPQLSIPQMSVPHLSIPQMSVPQFRFLEYRSSNDFSSNVIPHVTRRQKRGEVLIGDFD